MSKESNAVSSDPYGADPAYSAADLGSTRSPDTYNGLRNPNRFEADT